MRLIRRLLNDAIHRCGSYRVRYHAYAAIIFLREWWTTKILRRKSRHVLRWQFEAAFRAQRVRDYATWKREYDATRDDESFGYYESAPTVRITQHPPKKGLL